MADTTPIRRGKYLDKIAAKTAGKIYVKREEGRQARLTSTHSSKNTRKTNAERAAASVYLERERHANKLGHERHRTTEQAIRAAQRRKEVSKSRLEQYGYKLDYSDRKERQKLYTKQTQQEFARNKEAAEQRGAAIRSALPQPAEGQTRAFSAVQGTSASFVGIVARILIVMIGMSALYLVLTKPGPTTALLGKFQNGLGLVTNSNGIWKATGTDSNAPTGNK